MKTVGLKVLAVLAVIVIAGGAYLLGTSAALAPRTTSAAPALYSPDVVTGIYDSASPAVVEIRVTEQGTGWRMPEIMGSGFLIDDEGHILTNNHVVSGVSNVQVVLDEGKTVDGKVVGTDSFDDLALISIDPASVSSVTPLEFGDSSAVKPGEMAIAIGSPFGLTDSITVGVISGVNRSMGGRVSSISGMLQTDATINPGNSGGPLLNAQGEVIGINTALESSAGTRGIGFAVSSNVAVKVLPSLLAGTQITRPWLGISGTALTTEKAQSLGLSVNEGVYVVAVVPDSPAEKAGLKGAGTGTGGALPKGGDVIRAVDGKPVTSVEDLSAYFNTKKVGDTINLSVLRDGKSIDVEATLAAWPERVSPSIVPQPPMPNPDIPMPWPWGWRNRPSVPVPGS